VTNRLWWSITGIVGLLAVVLPPEAMAEKNLYASADGQGGFFDGTHYDAPSLDVVLAALKGKLTEPVVVQLLTAEAAPVHPTVFKNQNGECNYAISDVHGSGSNRLTIRGVRVGDRWLTQMAGVSVQDIIAKQFRCANTISSLSLGVTPLAAAALPSRVESLLEAFGRSDASTSLNAHLFSAGVQSSLVRCFKIADSEAITIIDMAFRDCWLPAIFVRDSKDVVLQDSLIEGSSYAFFAMSSGAPAGAANYRIENNLWIQDMTGYGADKAKGCREPSRDADCPGDMWSKIPWGVTHDLEFEHMNGALFGSRNSAGDVVFKGNTVRNAYNGLRMVPSRQCDAKCLTQINRNVVVADNHFAFIRDNPIEPESRAYNWKIRGNEFKNSHAWISLDGVTGGPVYVWSNTGWYTEIPGRDCNPAAKPRMERVDFQHGGYVRASSDEDLSCETSTFGTVAKVGAGSNIGQTYIFHNSWVIRTPLVRGGVTGPIHHWDNVLDFVGCGEFGEKICQIQTSAGDEECDKLADYFLPGKASLIFKCVDPRQPADPAIYDFAYDISSQGFPKMMGAELATPVGGAPTDPMLVAPAAGDLRLKAGSPAIGAGCVVRWAPGRSGELICSKGEPGEAAADIGAFSADGTRYEAPPLP